MIVFLALLALLLFPQPSSAVEFEPHVGSFLLGHDYIARDGEKSPALYGKPTVAVGLTAFLDLSSRWDLGLDIFGTYPRTTGDGAKLRNWVLSAAFIKYSSSGKRGLAFVFGAARTGVHLSVTGGGTGTGDDATTFTGTATGTRTVWVPAALLGFLIRFSRTVDLRLINYIQKPFESTRTFSTLVSLGVRL